MAEFWMAESLVDLITVLILGDNFAVLPNCVNVIVTQGEV